VTLHWAAPDRKRRDADNLVASAKVCCDALVRIGLVPEDTPDLMVKPTPVIHPPGDGPKHRVWLVVTELAPVEAEAPA
jgi:hypothetical protein